MLKQLILENWKSFRYAELPLDPLTVLIGTNASGKSNVVEALEFLRRIAQGENIETALVGNKTLKSIRGGMEWAARKGESGFTLKALIQDNYQETDYFYTINIQTIPKVRVIEEYIEIQNPSEDNTRNDKKIINIKNDFYFKRSGLQDADFHIDINELQQNISFEEQDIGNNYDFLEIWNKKILPLREKAKKVVVLTLENILILNPIASNMRNYSRIGDNLESDASNIAGVIAALPDRQKEEVEFTLSNYIKDLPEGDIKKIWAEKVARLQKDAMLYCQEEWEPGHITEIDAKTMSDGTLRFVAIITALLTRPEGSQIVIEEIDNGLHPSRAKLLVKILREIGSKRNIDILLTTHNPALLDALGPEIVPFVVVAHRDSETGESKLTLLEDVDNLPLLLASGSLGRLATTGAIEKSISHNE